VVRLGRESRVRYVRRLVWYVRCLAWCLRHEGTIIHVHDFDPLFVSYLAARLKHAGLVYDSHELWTSASELLRRSRLVRWLSPHLERFLAQRVDAVFQADRARAEDFAARYGLPQPQVLSNCSPLQMVEKTDLLRRAIGVGPEAKILIYSGGLARGRGIHPTLQAMELLPPHVHMVFMGFGLGVAHIEEFQRSSPWGARVHYVPAVAYDRIIPMIASADIGLALIQNVNRSYYLGAPTKLYEYMMAGIPAISSNFPEIRRIMDDVRFGEVVDPENPREIAAAVMKILGDARLYAEYRRNAQEGRKKYCWENQVQTLLAAYRQIALRKGCSLA
jgi:glycosyltransferase involved in cell wall biosynthesis